MTTPGDVTSEIKDALDREVARRFDTRRLLAGIERRAMRVTIAPAPGTRRPGAGPLGALPVAVQWAGIAAAFLGAALGLRSLYLEWTRVEPAAAMAHPAAPAAQPLVADAMRRRTAKTPSPALPRPARPAPAPPRAEQEREPNRQGLHEPSPALPAPRPEQRPSPPRPAESHDAVVVRGLATAPATPPPAAQPTRRERPARVASSTGPLIVSGPADPAAVAGLVGGVLVKSFRLGGRDLWPEVREVHEIGATLVMVPLGFRSAGGRSTPGTAGAPVFLLASLTPQAERRVGAAPLGITTGAYYARLFLGSPSDSGPHGQGLMGDGLQVVPLREDELWGDAAQEVFLRRNFGLKSVVAVDGAQILPTTDAQETGTSFTAGVGGQIFDVSLRGSADSGGLHTIELRISRQIDRQTHPESRVEDLEATLVVQNGRIVILGLPGRDTGRRAKTIAFLALSPQFAEFAPPADTEDVRPIDDDVDPPVLLDHPDVEYPPEARDLRLEGKVFLQAVIRKDGRVDGVQVLKVPKATGAEYLVEAAASSVRKWRYLPAQVHGEPVNVYVTISIEFTLQ